MAALEEYRSVLGGDALPVDVVTIEQELTQLWKSAADASDGHAVVRACVLNLVAYAPSDGIAEHINEVISQVSARYPSRSIVIVDESGTGPAHLRASISAHCQIPLAGGKQVCSEQVTLRASGSALDEVHGTVLPLLVPDLPVFLWWHHEPPSSHLFRELLDSADRLVIDSADFASAHVEDYLAYLVRLTADSDAALSDLNWSRLSQWRELVAQFFDASADRRYLRRLDQIAIEFASTHGTEADLTEGLLVVGWLASRLNWGSTSGAQWTSEGVVTISLTGESGPVRVDLTPDVEHQGEGIRSISLRAGDEAVFSVSREDDESCVAVTARLPEGASYSRAVRMETPSESELLSSALDMFGRDAVFEEALSHAVRFMKRRQ